MTEQLVSAARSLMLAERHALVYAIKARASFFANKNVVSLFTYRCNRRRWLERRRWVNEQMADSFKKWLTLS